MDCFSVFVIVFICIWLCNRTTPFNYFLKCLDNFMKLSVGLFGYDLLNIINHAFIDSYVHCNYYKARGCWSERGMLIAIREEGWGAAGRGVEGLNRKGKKRDALVCVWAQGQIWRSHKSWEGDARQNRAVISQNVNYPYSFSFCFFFPFGQST